MKKFKRVFSFLLAMVLTLAMSATVFATEVEGGEDNASGYTLTINGTAAGHTLKVYQIFTANLDVQTSEEDGTSTTTKVLSNVEWGEGVAYTGNYTSAQAVAEALSAGDISIDDLRKDLTLTTPIKTVTSVDDSTVISGLATGYYLVVDDTDVALEDGDAYSANIVQVVGDTVVNAKTSVPEFNKKVKDKNDSTGIVSGWQDSADYEIGDRVPFQLTAKLGDNLSEYDTYKVVFHDTLSKGLTLDIAGDEVEASDFTVTIDGTTLTSGYTVEVSTKESGETEITITLKDVLTLGATDKSEIVVTYSATLNSAAEIGSTGNPNEAYLEYSNSPENSGEGDSDNTGDTPKDKVIVFTYKYVVNKVDEKGDALEGAGFTLYKWIYDEASEDKGSWVAVGDEINGVTTFGWNVDDGDYKLVETTTPAGYNTMDDVYFTISAAHDETSDNPTLTELKLTKKADGDGEADVVSGVVSTGTITENVTNYSGSTLPSTGGIGTTIFYVLGGILVLAAGVILIARKRAAR